MVSQVRDVPLMFVYCLPVTGHHLLFTIHYSLIMEIINRRQRMSSVARKIRREQDKTIGLVPTMGALHEGHLSLVKEARQMCDIVVVSVFVNPAQFGPSEDYEHYPRDLTKDTAVLTDYNIDYIFAPTVEEVYPKGYSTYVTVEGLSDQLEGVSRPGALSRRSHRGHGFSEHHSS